MAGRVAPYVDNTGLVFAYDQSNTVRSYLGQPATNVITSGIPGYFGSGGETLYQESLLGLRSDSGVFQRNFVTNPALADSGTYNNNGGLYKNFSTSTLSSSTRYIQISFDFYMITRYRTFASSTTGLNGYIGITYADSTTGDHGWNTTYSNGSGDDWSNDAAYVGRWQKVSLIAALNDKSPSSINAMYIYADRLTQGEGVFTNFIITEHATFPTGPVRYTPGTRSVTQGLKDLTGNSTIDLSNVSFDSNAQMTWDGTDDQIAVTGFTQPTDPNIYSVEAVVKLYTHNPGTNIGSVIVNNYSSLYGWIFYLNGPLSYLGIRHHDGASGGYDLVYGTGINLNQFYHIVATDDKTTVRLYLNGIQVASRASATALNYSGQPTIGQFGGNNAVTNGEIPVVKIYNKALSASEIQQNFNAVRGRYGI
jgi:hypothetical protein